MLKKEDIDYQISSNDADCEIVAETIEYFINENITQEQVDLFIILFHGRTDVYARRFISKAGNVGYSPVCSNFWRHGVCPKVDKQKIKCYECSNHNWISLARRFGTALLTKGAESVNQKNFKSYDRMLPAQDKMPEGGFGNLIALPMQGQTLRNGNSAFINENWRVIADPWEAIKTVKKVSRKFVEDKISEWVQNGVLGVLADEIGKENDIMGDTDAKPWDKKKPSLLYNDDIQGYVEITLANQIYIKNHNIKPRAP